MNRQHIIKRIAGRYRLAMDFPTEEARKKYLQDHPNADPSNHKVKKNEGGGGGKASELYQKARGAEKAYKKIQRLKEQAGKRDGDKAAEAFKGAHEAASSLHDLGISVHKKLSDIKAPWAEKEFDILKKSLHKMEKALNETKDGSMPGFSAKELADAAEELYGDLHRIGALSLS